MIYGTRFDCGKEQRLEERSAFLFSFFFSLKLLIKSAMRINRSGLYIGFLFYAVDDLFFFCPAVGWDGWVGMEGWSMDYMWLSCKLKEVARL